MKKIYLVDDDQLILSRLKVDFEEILNGGCEISTFLDPLEALAFFEKNDCSDVYLFSDIHMIPMSGVELVRQIRSKSLSFKSIVFITSTADIALISEIATLKCNGYILKPWASSKLLDSLR